MAATVLPCFHAQCLRGQAAWPGHWTLQGCCHDSTLLVGVSVCLLLHLKQVQDDLWVFLGLDLKCQQCDQAVLWLPTPSGAFSASKEHGHRLRAKANAKASRRSSRTMNMVSAWRTAPETMLGLDQWGRPR